jgi:hypothetical protein
MYADMPEALPENPDLPCACGSWRKHENPRQNCCRALAHGEYHTATKATANPLCREQIESRTAKVFAVCSQPTHGEVKQQTVPVANGNQLWPQPHSAVRRIFAVCSSFICRVPTFTVCPLSTDVPRAVCRGQLLCRGPADVCCVPGFAVCPLSKDDPCPVCRGQLLCRGPGDVCRVPALPYALFLQMTMPSLPCAVTLPWARSLSVCRAFVYAVCRHTAQTQSRACFAAQQHSLPTRVSFAVSKHTAEDIWFICRVQAHSKSPIFSLF